MDKIIEFINKQSNNKFKDLLFFGAVYDMNSNALAINFNTKNEEDLEKFKISEIQEIVKDFFSANVKLNIKIKHIKFDEEICKKEIKLIFENLEIKNFLNLEDIKVFYDENEREYVIKFPCAESNLSSSFKEEINSKIQIILSKYGIEDFRLCFDETKKLSNNELESRIKKAEESYEDELISPLQFIDKEDFIGEIKDVEELILVNNEIGQFKNIAICGKLTKVIIKEFTKNEKTKKFANFTICNEEDKISCVCFSKDVEKLTEIENKDILAIGETSIDGFSKRLSFKVKSISIGKVILPVYKDRAVNEDYYFIKPEKYVELTQANFLLDNENINKPYLLDNTFVVFDLETTGLNASSDSIIEIGAVKLVNGKIVEQFSTFVDPKVHIPEEASSKNHIYDDMVAGAPTIEQALPDFYKFCYGSTLVAYNIDFDYGFIKKYGKKLRYNFNHEQNDAYKLAQKHIKGVKNYKLGTICEHLGVSLVGAHRAVNDTIATAKVFVKLVENFG